MIFALLFGLGLGSAVLAGFGTAAARARSWTHIVGFAAVIALCVFVVLDIEYPRLGFIPVTGTDQVLVELLQSMN